MLQSFTQHSLDIGQKILAKRSNAFRKDNGQFLTPAPLATFMAAQLGVIHDGTAILDPAMGSGTLLCALIERLIAEKRPLEVWIDGFELDEELFDAARSVLGEAVRCAVVHGIRVHLNLFQTDFVLNGLRFLRPSLLDTPVGHRHYQHIIANPPYFKINAADMRRIAADGLLSGHTNIYTLFMGLAANMLRDGRATFIVPRSFCSGTYFTRFRREFLSRAVPERIHLFEKRDDAFGLDNVLQENLVITFACREEKSTSNTMLLSTSTTLEDLTESSTPREIRLEQFLSPSGLFRLPTSDIDDMILAAVDRWRGSFHEFGMEISTGPVVAFRAKTYLVDKPDGMPVVPLLWMQHIKPQQVMWPLDDTFHKPQYIQNSVATRALLVKNTDMVLLRRFSAKEEHRRLVAAPYLAENHDDAYVGLENHLNYIYHRDQRMDVQEAIGLSALLNSGLIDRYFRISNGNTQVNATELRALPLPPPPVITAIGQTLTSHSDQLDLDTIVIQTLQSFGLLTNDFPVLRETRVV